MRRMQVVCAVGRVLDLSRNCCSSFNSRCYANLRVMACQSPAFTVPAKEERLQVLQAAPLHQKAALSIRNSSRRSSPASRSYLLCSTSWKPVSLRASKQEKRPTRHLPVAISAPLRHVFPICQHGRRRGRPSASALRKMASVAPM